MAGFLRFKPVASSALLLTGKVAVILISGRRQFDVHQCFNCLHLLFMRRHICDLRLADILLGTILQVYDKERLTYHCYMSRPWNPTRVPIPQDRRPPHALKTFLSYGSPAVTRGKLLPS